MTRKMKDGDVYFWSWKSLENRAMPYHCRSRKAVVFGNRLCDTFWADSSSNWLALGEIDIEYQGNLREMDEINAFRVDHYRPADIVDMRHENQPEAKIYRKPGAKLDAKVMRGHVQHLIEREENKIRAGKVRIGWLRDALITIEDGRLDDVHF